MVRRLARALQAGAHQAALHGERRLGDQDVHSGAEVVVRPQVVQLGIGDHLARQRELRVLHQVAADDPALVADADRAVAARQHQQLRVAQPAGGDHHRLRRGHVEACRGAVAPRHRQRGQRRPSGVGLEPDDRTIEQHVDLRRGLQHGPELLGEARRRHRRHGPIQEPGDERRLVADELGAVIEDGRGAAPVPASSPRRRWATGPRSRGCRNRAASGSCTSPSRPARCRPARAPSAGSSSRRNSGRTRRCGRR